MRYSLFLLLLSVFACNRIVTEKIESAKINDGRQLNRYFYDADGKQVTSTQFYNTLNYAFHLDCSYIQGDSLITQIYNRQKFGKMNPDQLLQFEESIEVSIDKDLDFDKPLVLGYLRPNWEGDDCLEFFLIDNRINTQYNKDHAITYITDKPADQSLYQHPSYYDRHRVLESIFINQRVACGTWLAIKPDGSYYLYYGEISPLTFFYFEEEWDEEFIEGLIYEGKVTRDQSRYDSKRRHQSFHILNSKP